MHEIFFHYGSVAEIHISDPVTVPVEGSSGSNTHSAPLFFEAEPIVRVS